MISTINREPVEVIIAPGSHHDSKVFKQFDLDLPEKSTLYADSGFTDYEYEELVKEAGINLLVARKSNSKRPHKPWISALISYGRKASETTFSQINALLPKSIHAITRKGFEIKVFSFILAYSFSCL